MSTRANIIVKDSYDELIFYRHSDGYPDGAMPLLEKFLDLVKSGKIRDNVQQSAGWLIILGAIEYQSLTNDLFPQGNKRIYEQDNSVTDKVIKNFQPKDWKCGAIEPTTQIHGDIEYLYVIDLETQQIHIDGRDYEYTGKFAETVDKD